MRSWSGLAAKGRRGNKSAAALASARATANRRYQYALALIAWRLNGRSVPTKRSRAFLVERFESGSRDSGLLG